MLAIASFAVGVVASLATPTVQPSTDGEAAGGTGERKAKTSAPDLALGASDAGTGADTGVDTEKNSQRTA